MLTYTTKDKEQLNTSAFDRKSSSQMKSPLTPALYSGIYTIKRLEGKYASVLTDGFHRRSMAISILSRFSLVLIFYTDRGICVRGSYKAAVVTVTV